MTLDRWWHDPEQRGMVLPALSSSGLMPGWDQVSGFHYEPCPLCLQCIASSHEHFLFLDPSSAQRVLLVSLGVGPQDKLDLWRKIHTFPNELCVPGRRCSCWGS